MLAGESTWMSRTTPPDGAPTVLNVERTEKWQERYQPIPKGAARRPGGVR